MSCGTQEGGGQTGHQYTRVAGKGVCSCRDEHTLSELLRNGFSLGSSPPEGSCVSTAASASAAAALTNAPPATLKLVCWSTFRKCRSCGITYKQGGSGSQIWWYVSRKTQRSNKTKGNPIPGIQSCGGHHIDCRGGRSAFRRAGEAAPRRLRAAAGPCCCDSHLHLHLPGCWH